MLELRSLLHATKVPAIYVTHDQEEAFTLADRIFLLHDGRIVQSGTPRQVWEEPVSPWAARFLDAGNVIDGVVRECAVKTKIESIVGTYELDCAHAHQRGDKVNLLVRPSPVQVVEKGGFQARVMDVQFRQEEFKVTVEGDLYFYLLKPPPLGEKIHLMLSPEQFLCLGKSE